MLIPRLLAIFRRRRAVALVLVAVMVTVLPGFAVRTIDVGVLYNSRSDMQHAADWGIRIYTINVGYGADRVVMQGIAAITNGQEFYAQGTPEEYTAQLRLLSETLAAWATRC